MANTINVIKVWVRLGGNKRIAIEAGVVLQIATQRANISEEGTTVNDDLRFF